VSDTDDVVLLGVGVEVEGHRSRGLHNGPGDPAERAAPGEGVLFLEQEHEPGHRLLIRVRDHTFLPLLHNLVDAEGCGSLPQRKLSERRQKPPRELLRGHGQEGGTKRPLVVGGRGDVGPLRRVHAQGEELP
jgi:hypothetical protein